MRGEGDGQPSALENAYVFLPWSLCILFITMYVFEYWHEQATSRMVVRRLKGSYTELYFSMRTLDGWVIYICDILIMYINLGCV